MTGILVMLFVIALGVFEIITAKFITRGQRGMWIFTIGFSTAGLLLMLADRFFPL